MSRLVSIDINIVLTINNVFKPIKAVSIAVSDV